MQEEEEGLGMLPSGKPSEVHGMPREHASVAPTSSRLDGYPRMPTPSTAAREDSVHEGGAGMGCHTQHMPQEPLHTH